MVSLFFGFTGLLLQVLGLYATVCGVLVGVVALAVQLSQREPSKKPGPREGGPGPE